MNRFVYLVHADYRDPTAPSLRRSAAQSPLEKMAKLGAELGRYLPDTRAQISGVRIRCDPDVIRVTVVTALDEAIADSAFVRFVRGCKAAPRAEQTVAAEMAGLEAEPINHF
jgi:hypothetical protein